MVKLSREGTELRIKLSVCVRERCGGLDARDTNNAKFRGARSSDTRDNTIERGEEEDEGEVEERGRNCGSK
jgi:hypothetical protein